MKLETGDRVLIRKGHYEGNMATVIHQGWSGKVLVAIDGIADRVAFERDEVMVIEQKRGQEYESN